MSSLHIHKHRRLLLYTTIATILAVPALGLAINKLTTADSANAATHPIPPGYTTFTDENFYDCVASTYLNSHPSADISEGLTDAQLAEITSLNCNKTPSTPNTEKIFNTIGLEKMTGLTGLSLSYNNITDGLLDVSHNTALTQLIVDHNYLTSLDVSHNTNLTMLYAFNNNLTSLTLPSHSALTSLQVNNNALSSIDISGAPALTDLYVHSNVLESLDTSNNPSLIRLIATSNFLTSLDVSQNPALASLNVGNNQLTSLDVSNNTHLTMLVAVNNQLTSLNISGNASLTTVNAGNNQLTSLDISHNTALTELYVNGNHLTDLDVSHNPILASLNADNIMVWSNIGDFVSTQPDIEINLASLNFLQSNQTIYNTESYTYDSASRLVTVNEPNSMDYIQISSNASSRTYKLKAPKFLTYNTNEGEGEFEPLSCSVEFGFTNCEVTLTTDEPTREGYYFLGWANEAGATGATYQAGDTVTLSSSKTIFAIWAPIYTLSFDLNEGTGTIEEQTCHPDTKDGSCAATVPDAEITRDGYDFLGWADTADATSAVYQAGDAVTLDDDKTIYAVWQEPEPAPEPEPEPEDVPVPDTGTITKTGEGIATSVTFYGSLAVATALVITFIVYRKRKNAQILDIIQ
ncbi:InlB B-repeat-containing protein [Candidatus Saccharibacteria bacterium]|nr:InlB B-repeat-containing protein [Candidatus Saccharibacteria bacterium]